MSSSRRRVSSAPLFSALEKVQVQNTATVVSAGEASLSWTSLRGRAVSGGDFDRSIGGNLIVRAAAAHGHKKGWPRRTARCPGRTDGPAPERSAPGYPYRRGRPQRRSPSGQGTAGGRPPIVRTRCIHWPPVSSGWTDRCPAGGDLVLGCGLLHGGVQAAPSHGRKNPMPTKVQASRSSARERTGFMGGLLPGKR